MVWRVRRSQSLAWRRRNLPVDSECPPPPPCSPSSTTDYDATDSCSSGTHTRRRRRRTRSRRPSSSILTRSDTLSRRRTQRQRPSPPDHRRPTRRWRSRVPTCRRPPRAYRTPNCRPQASRTDRLMVCQRSSRRSTSTRSCRRRGRRSTTCLRPPPRLRARSCLSGRSLVAGQEGKVGGEREALGACSSCTRTGGYPLLRLVVDEVLSLLFLHSLCASLLLTFISVSANRLVCLSALLSQPTPLLPLEPVVLPAHLLIALVPYLSLVSCSLSLRSPVLALVPLTTHSSMNPPTACCHPTLWYDLFQDDSPKPSCKKPGPRDEQAEIITIPLLLRRQHSS